jgi:hypothetical protein
METCTGVHHVGPELAVLIQAKYVKPFLKGHKSDYRDAKAIAESDPVGTRDYRSARVGANSRQSLRS